MKFGWVTPNGVSNAGGYENCAIFGKYTMIQKIGTPLYFCNNFFKC